MQRQTAALLGLGFVAALIGVILIAVAGIVYQMRDLASTAASIRREGYRI